MRSNKDYRVRSLKDFQDKDYEDVLKRPVFCAKQRHEKEELKYFCENCIIAVCQTCVLMDHSGHALEHIEDEAERQKRIEMKRESLREFYRGHFCLKSPKLTLACVRSLIHQQVCRGI